MNKIMKVAISIVMSFAMVVCLASTEAGAKAVSAPEDGISPQGFNVGEPYSITGKYTKITAYFTSATTLLVRCKNLTNTNRYMELFVSTPSTSFVKRTFTVKGGEWHSVSYNISPYNTSKVVITVYLHKSSSSNSARIDQLTGIMLD